MEQEATRWRAPRATARTWPAPCDEQLREGSRRSRGITAGLPCGCRPAGHGPAQPSALTWSSPHSGGAEGGRGRRLKREGKKEKWEGDERGKDKRKRSKPKNMQEQLDKEQRQDK